MFRTTKNNIMKIKELTSYLDSQVHPEYQEDYDNAGFLLGDPDAECTGVLVALDLTLPVINEARERGVNCIVTHHPFIFSGLKRITADTATGNMVYQLILNHISVYSAHTNLDNMASGVNAALADHLGLTDCHILRPMAGQNDPAIGAGMVGHLPYPIPAEMFFSQLKGVLGLPQLRTSEICCQTVSRVAICGGAGSFLIGDAIRQQADVYLTGDMKYHDFQRAEGRITLVDIGHYESEQFCKELIYSIISKKFSNFACLISEKGRSYVHFI